MRRETVDGLQLKVAFLALSSFTGHMIGRDKCVQSTRAPAFSSMTIMAPGEQSEEVFLWYTVVYEAIQEVPRGRVTTYAHIARLVGKREPSPPK